MSRKYNFVKTEQKYQPSVFILFTAVYIKCFVARQQCKLNQLFCCYADTIL